MRLNLTILWLLLFAYPVSADTRIHIIKSSSIPRSNRLVEIVRSDNRSLEVIEYDLDSRARSNMAVVESIEANSKGVDNNFVISIGYPAAKLAMKELSAYRVINTMVNRQRVQTDMAIPANALFISDKPKLQRQLNILRQIAPRITSVGVITSNSEQPPRTQDSDIEVRYEYVDSSKEVPAAYRRLSESVDALVFLQDPLVMNKDSLEFLVTKSFADKIPTFAYSEYLVKAGFMASAIKPVDAVAVEIGEIIERESGIEQRARGTAVEEYYLIINRRTLTRMGITINENDEIELRWIN